MKLPTDFQILNYIYADYYDAFSAFDSDAPERRTKIYIPIDISAIANRLVLTQISSSVDCTTTWRKTLL